MSNEQHESTLSELAAVRDELKKKSAQLGEAKAVILFYSNHQNWRLAASNIPLFQDRIRDDHSEATNNPKFQLGGKRAREYLAKFDDEN